jgi:exodeoxyribonuclease VII small subunit
MTLTTEDPTRTYESALTQLESLVARLDAGQLPLNEVLTQYKQGIELLNFCRGKLEQIESQVQVLEHGELARWQSA